MSEIILNLFLPYSDALTVFVFCLVLCYVSYAALVSISNLHWFKPLPSEANDVGNKRISVLIPARNEAGNLGDILDHMLDEKDPNLEVIVLDDHSTDGTPQVVKSYLHQTQNIRLITGKDLPQGWLGKNWACHQLGETANGDYLFFMDADVKPEAGITKKIRQVFENGSIDFLSIWPQQHMVGLWQKAVIPLMYHTLLTLLPEKYVETAPAWIPSAYRERTSYLFSAACGQALVFTRKAYDTIGGHESVRSEVVEDVQLARRIKRNGFRMAMFSGLDSISCSMYPDSSSMYQGFRKNFLAGFNNNLPLFLFMGVIQLAVVLLPVYLLISSFILKSFGGLILAAPLLLLLAVSRIAVHKTMQWPLNWMFLHGLGVLWYWRLAFTCMADYLFQRSAKWKGRDLRH